MSGVEVSPFEFLLDGSVSYVHTNRGKIAVGQVIIGGGPWNKNLWAMLGLPLKIEVKDCQGHFHKDRDMWTYWRLAEAEARVSPERYLTAEGKYPPVIHVDSAEPLISDKTGQIITDKIWGIY